MGMYLAGVSTRQVDDTGQLGAVLSWHDRTRTEGRPARGGRPVRGTRVHRRLDAARGEVPAVHGALHAQRALQDAAQSPRMGGGPYLNIIRYC